MNLRYKKLSVVIAIVFAVGLLGAVGSVLGVFWWYGRGVAELDEERLKNYRPPQVTRIYARDGELIGELYSQRRTLIDYEDIPSHVENAFLAAEDADFYRHEGMDYMGMVRALVANVRAGEIRQGASTITQQVVKNFMLSPERSFERKVQELILARRLERAFTKKEILELYLNEIYLGHGRYGIEEASRFYFGRSVRDLDLGQAALLATLPKAPGRDSPIRNPERSKERQRYVLRQLVRHGFATEKDIEPYLEAPLELADAEARPTLQPGAEEFVDEARRRLVALYGEDALDTLGAEVITTVALPLQREARAAAVHGLQAVDKRNAYARRLEPATEKARAAAQARGQQGFAVGAVRPAVIEARPADPALPEHGFAARVGDHAVFVAVEPESRHDAPERSLEEQFPAGAIVDVRILPAGGEAPELPSGWSRAEIAEGPEAAVVLLDAPTGEVLALVGGSTYERAGFNRATQAKRQPGSSFKPFVYGAALQSGLFTAATLVSDSPEIYEKWRPTNFTADQYLGDIRLRVALTKSINTVAIKLLDRIGVEAVHAFAKAAGIQTALPANLSLALGTGEVTPFELATAYLTLARGGSRIEPVFLREVRVRGVPQELPAPRPEQALPEDVVFVLTSMMQSVVEEGTGQQAKALGRPVAGKTGTSGDFHDAWFAGFTPQRVAVAWVGFDQPKKIGAKETGGKAALPIWLEAMQAASEGPPQPFSPPTSVAVRRIDAQSGLLAPTGSAAEGYAGAVLEEFFVAGTEPVDEAIPAALPAGDVLLDLYGEGAAAAGADLGGDAFVATTPTPIAPPPVEAMAAAANPAAPRPQAGRFGDLPSLDDAD